MSVSIYRYVAAATLAGVLGCGSSQQTAQPNLSQQVEGAATIDDPEVRARTLLDLAAQQRAMKDTPGAAATTDLALKAAQDIPNPGPKAALLVEIAKNLADIGSKIAASDAIDSARVAVATIDDRRAKIAANIGLAQALISMQDSSTATTVLNNTASLLDGVTSDEEKVPLQASLIAARIRIGGLQAVETQLKAATEEAAAIPDVRARVRAQSDAAAAFYQAGQANLGKPFYDAAVASARSLTDPMARGYALVDVIETLRSLRTQLPLGDLAAEAQQSAEQVPSLDQRNVLLRQIQASRTAP